MFGVLKKTADPQGMPPPESAVSPHFPSQLPAKSMVPLSAPIMSAPTTSAPIILAPTISAPTIIPRTLPSKDVNEANIDETFAHFILFANPSFPIDTDVSELKRVFRSPPRSDGKDFGIYRLFELLRKFENKEIKTWGQLALDLGVEPPSTEKGGSVQKVQQYTVRLKRWMRALHVDSFFEYLMGKQHSYFTAIPPIDDPYPEEGRDGVSSEEDLALRALDPSLRPKRGRRRNATPDESSPPPKKLALIASGPPDGQAFMGQPQSAYPVSATPMSAHPGHHDPWTAVSAVAQAGFGMRTWTPQSAAPSNVRWKAYETPITPHPMSAITNNGGLSLALEEPNFATTPSSKTRPRRKHGPAVSSAWPSNSGTNNRIRGRPPGTRPHGDGVQQDGHFSTFSAHPTTEKSPSTQQRPLVSLPDESPDTVLQEPPSTLSVRPERERLQLQLQVPPHTGGPVHLMTPSPPAPVLNIQPLPLQQQPNSAYESLKRALAASLLRANLTGRRNRLTANEAKALSDSILARLDIPTQDTEDKSDDALRIAAASWLGLSKSLGYEGGRGLGGDLSGGKTIVVRRFGRDEEGYEVPLPSPTGTTDEPTTNVVKELFDISWSLSFGVVGGQFSIKGLEITGNTSIGKSQTEYKALEDQAEQILNSVRNNQDGEVDWKGKFMALSISALMMRGRLELDREQMLSRFLDCG